MRYLAVDLGDKRTGLAGGDSITMTAGPIELVEVPLTRDGGEALLQAIADAAGRFFGAPTGGGEVVVGLPLNMDGTEGDRAKLTRAFAERIGARLGRAVHLHDERQSSERADQRMAKSGLTHKQKKLRRDALAAAVLLSDFLERHAASEPTPWLETPDPSPGEPHTGWRR